MDKAALIDSDDIEDLSVEEPNKFLKTQDNDEEKDEKQFNPENPGFSERIQLYLKPTEMNECSVFLLLAFDWILACVYFGFEVNYILNGNFTGSKGPSDKIMQVIIGLGITMSVLGYSIADAVRFLPRWHDKLLYVISCCLLKPILLPVILGGYCF